MFAAVSFTITVTLLFPVVMFVSLNAQSIPPNPFSEQLFVELKLAVVVPLNTTIS